MKVSVIVPYYIAESEYGDIVVSRKRGGDVASQEKGKGTKEATNDEEGARDLVSGADMRTAGDTGHEETILP